MLRFLSQKQSAAPATLAGTKAAAKSRLAAVKAAMKARQQAAEKVAKDAGNEDDANPNSQKPQPQAVSQPADPVVFDGGFFQVESPVKPSGDYNNYLPKALHVSVLACVLFLVA